MLAARLWRAPLCGEALYLLHLSVFHWRKYGQVEKVWVSPHNRRPPRWAASMDRFYESWASPLCPTPMTHSSTTRPGRIAGDVDYERLARETSGPVLELACGTGRIALPLAERGLDVAGVDASDGMLAIAERKSAARSPAARQRRSSRSCAAGHERELTGPAIRLHLRGLPHRGGGSGGADLQRRTLVAIQRHLERNSSGGAAYLADPRVDLLINGCPGPVLLGIEPATQRRWLARSCGAASTIWRRSTAISGGTRSLWRMVRRWRRLPARWRCDGRGAGNCVTCWSCAASWSKRSTATSRGRLPHMARN